MYCKNLSNTYAIKILIIFYVYYIKTCQNAKIEKCILKIYLCFIRNNKNAFQSFQIIFQKYKTIIYLLTYQNSTTCSDVFLFLAETNLHRITVVCFSQFTDRLFR